MPRMSGRVLAECLAQDSPEIRVLFISDKLDEEGPLELSKPFSPADLARKVREVLDAAPQS